MSACAGGGGGGRSKLSMLRRPNRQSLAAVLGPRPAAKPGGGKLRDRSRHCRSLRRTILPSSSLAAARDAPQSMTPPVGAWFAAGREYSLGGSADFCCCRSDRSGTFFRVWEGRSSKMVEAG